MSNHDHLSPLMKRMVPADFHEIIQQLLEKNGVTDVTPWETQTYYIIADMDVSNFTRNVRVAIMQGWQPLGSPTIMNLEDLCTYKQAVWRPYSPSNLPLILNKIGQDGPEWQLML